MHRTAWDREGTRSSVRETFAKVVDCGTEALGAEVFASEGEERVVLSHLRMPYFCRAHCCNTCAPRTGRSCRRCRFLLNSGQSTSGMVRQTWAYGTSGSSRHWSRCHALVTPNQRPELPAVPNLLPPEDLRRQRPTPQSGRPPPVSATRSRPGRSSCGDRAPASSAPTSAPAAAR